MPICGTCNAQWKKWNWIAALSWVPGLLFWMLGVTVGGDVGGVIVLFGLLAVLGALITTLVMRSSRIVVANKIDATHSWLGKIHPTALQFLFQMPTATAPAYVASQGYPQAGYGAPAYPRA